MTDDELAELFADMNGFILCEMCPRVDEPGTCFREECIEYAKEWLEDKFNHHEEDLQ